MKKNETSKRKKTYTIINICLICFLIIIATVGMRGLTASSWGGNLPSGDAGYNNDKIMVCAIGQCLLV